MNTYFEKTLANALIAEYIGTHTLKITELKNEVSLLITDRNGNTQELTEDSCSSSSTDMDFVSMYNCAGSLDDMHEVEKPLTDNQWDDYRDRLASLDWRLVNATAVQRTEAYLKVIEKYDLYLKLIAKKNSDSSKISLDAPQPSP